jgi:hypothetical protein
MLHYDWPTFAYVLDPSYHISEERCYEGLMRDPTFRNDQRWSLYAVEQSANRLFGQT